MSYVPKIARQLLLNKVLAVIVLFSGAFNSTVLAQAVPFLSSTAPLVIQPGHNITVTLAGQHLARVSSTSIAEARGLEATVVRSSASTQPTTPSEDGKLQLKLTADADAALGDRELRLVGSTGISAPLHVIVSQFPQAAEKEPNNTQQLAQEITLPAVITGTMDAPGDVDCFRFFARDNDRLVFDVHAARSGSRLDPIIILHDSTGRELPIKVDTHAGDPTVLFTAPADGEYEIEIRDLEFRGGSDFIYRIDAGAIPYVQAFSPSSAQPGRFTSIQPIGINLQGLDHLSLDLSYAGLGPISLRGHSSAGFTNEVPFQITDLPAYAEKGNNHAVADAEAVPFPVDVSGHVDSAGDENFFKFHIDRKQLVTIEAAARNIGSPLESLLTLRNIKGESISTKDTTGGVDPRITRELDAGDYLASIRDLTYHGGPSYAFRLRLRPGGSGSGQDFAVKFLPDAIRVSQAGTTAVMCDVQRMGGFKGDVTLTLEGLPPGVNVPPVVLAANGSDVFTVTAGKAAALGTYPITLRASAIIDNEMVTKTAEAMLGERPVQQAYLTVMEPAPFTIEALTALSPANLQQLNGETMSLAQKLAGPTPEILAAQAQWEKKIATPLVWTVLDGAKVRSSGGTQFKELPDGSFLSTGNVPDKDTYTFIATTHETNITAIRLEVLPDDSLPNKGPGRREGEGNFVLSKFTASAAPADESTKAAAVALHDPRALHEQAGYPIVDALTPKPEKGWATSPYFGQPNAAYFFTATPITNAGGTTLTIALDQQFNSHFTIGRFRLSVSGDPDAIAKAGLPADVTDAAAIAPEQRTEKQKSLLAARYRLIDPQLSAQANRLQVLRKAVGAPSELAKLEAALNVPAPQLDAERAAWEKRIIASAWVPLSFADTKSQSGATFTKDADGSLLVSGTNAPTDVYTLTAISPARTISAIRLEALPDSTLAAGGPGRSPGGNFVLTRLGVTAGAAGTMASSVEFRGAVDSFHQQGFAALGALDDRDDTGWAIAPNVGVPAQATFFPKEAIPTETGTQLVFTLEQKYAAAAQHALGRFRIWVTANPDPEAAPMLPADVLAAIRIPLDKRDAAQKAVVLNYYRAAIAPSLAPTRYRAEELKNQLADAATFVQYRQGEIPLLINRNSFSGEVTVTLEGYSANGKRPIATSVVFDPQRIAPDAQSGALSFRVQPASETGTRLAVLRAQAIVNGETYVQYSSVFPLTLAPAR